MESAIETTPIEALWTEFHGELLAFARPRLSSEGDAEDVLQLAFMRAHRQLEEGTSPKQPRAWLYQIVRNLIIDAYRQKARRQEVPEPEVEDAIEALEAPDSLEMEEETRAVVARSLPLFIDRLKSPYREALRLTELEGLTQAEAARRVGVSLSGMKSRVQRGRKLLLRSLHQCCEFGVDARRRVVSCSPREEAGSHEVDDCSCSESDPPRASGT